MVTIHGQRNVGYCPIMQKLLSCILLVVVLGCGGTPGAHARPSLPAGPVPVASGEYWLRSIDETGIAFPTSLSDLPPSLAATAPELVSSGSHDSGNPEPYITAIELPPAAVPEDVARWQQGGLLFFAESGEYCAGRLETFRLHSFGYVSDLYDWAARKEGMWSDGIDPDSDEGSAALARGLWNDSEVYLIASAVASGDTCAAVIASTPLWAQPASDPVPLLGKPVSGKLVDDILAAIRASARASSDDSDDLAAGEFVVFAVPGAGYLATYYRIEYGDGYADPEFGTKAYDSLFRLYSVTPSDKKLAVEVLVDAPCAGEIDTRGMADVDRDGALDVIYRGNGGRMDVLLSTSKYDASSVAAPDGQCPVPESTPEDHDYPGDAEDPGDSDDAGDQGN